MWSGWPPRSRLIRTLFRSWLAARNYLRPVRIPKRQNKLIVFFCALVTPEWSWLDASFIPFNSRETHSKSQNHFDWQVVWLRPKLYVFRNKKGPVTCALSLLNYLLCVDRACDISGSHRFFSADDLAAKTSIALKCNARRVTAKWSPHHPVQHPPHHVYKYTGTCVPLSAVAVVETRYWPSAKLCFWLSLSPSRGPSSLILSGATISVIIREGSWAVVHRRQFCGRMGRECLALRQILIRTNTQ